MLRRVADGTRLVPNEAQGGTWDVFCWVRDLRALHAELVANGTRPKVVVGFAAESRDLAAFIALALAQISAGIDVSVAAWEKRGYWVKADRFRMEWLWSASYADKMKAAVLSDDWATVALTMTQVAQKLSKIQVPAGHRLGRPWVGAWKRLKES